jgi:catechol 2,3-dioxygenase-like lactoylglutathione lyase family enzyme
MAYGFEHAHIKSRDPRKTAKWWADHFAARILPEIQASGGALFCPVEIGGVKINITTPRQHELSSIQEAYAGSHYGLEHLGITTEDIDADIARLRAQGLEVFEVNDTPTLKFAFVETPDGVRIELMQRKGQAT